MRTFLKLLFLNIIVLLNSSISFCQLDSNSKAKLYFTEAETQFNQNNYKTALEYIEKTEATLGSTNGRILNLKIKSLYNDGQFAAAQKMLDQFSKYENEVTSELKNDTYSYFVKIERYLEKENARRVTTRQSDKLLIDRRNGRQYKTVKIGNQVWMAENLNFDAGYGCYCYDNIEANCSKYGRLYVWKLAKEVCPSGWHLPSVSEWDELVETVKIGMQSENIDKYLKSVSGWNTGKNGTDNYGFTALPGGVLERLLSGSNLFFNCGDFGFWWSATERDADLSLAYLLTTGSMHYQERAKRDACSVRCVRD